MSKSTPLGIAPYPSAWNLGIQIQELSWQRIARWVVRKLPVSCNDVRTLRNLLTSDSSSAGLLHQWPHHFVISVDLERRHSDGGAAAKLPDCYKSSTFKMCIHTACFSPHHGLIALDIACFGPHRDWIAPNMQLLTACKLAAIPLLIWSAISLTAASPIAPRHTSIVGWDQCATKDCIAVGAHFKDSPIDRYMWVVSKDLNIAPSCDRDNILSGPGGDFCSQHFALGGQKGGKKWTIEGCGGNLTATESGNFYANCQPIPDTDEHNWSDCAMEFVCIP
ncbi:hypothetical protein DFH06DRAFT_1152096 [Mycena polygramma]|nr:hypothetical protein DFH06DRAFT_1152096 [Mycena polygramma]